MYDSDCTVSQFAQIVTLLHVFVM